MVSLSKRKRKWQNQYEEIIYKLYAIRWATLIFSSESVVERMHHKGNYNFLFEKLKCVVRESFKGIVLIMLGAVVNTAMLIFVPKLTTNVLYATISGGALYIDFVFLGCLIVVARVISYYTALERNKIRINVNCQMKTEVLKKILTIGYAQETQGDGKVISILSSDSNVVAEILFSLERLIISSIQVLICMCLMSRISWEMLVVSICVNGIFLGINFAFRAKIIPLKKESTCASDQVLNSTKDIVMWLTELVANSCNEKIIGFYDKAVVTAKQVITKTEKKTLQVTSITSMARLANIFAVLLTANKLMNQENLSGDNFLAFMIYMQYAISATQQLLVLPSLAATYKVKIDRIAEIYSAMKWRNLQLAGKTSVCCNLKQLDVIELSCSIQNKVILRKVTLSIKPGELCVITGPNGAGKTTLLRIMTGQVIPTSGAVYVNGEDVRRIDINSYLERISVLQTEVFFDDMSILENLALYSPETPGMNDISLLCKSLGVYEEIAALPEGFDTVVSGSEIRFSKGQLQRMCIARCLLKKADIYIFDEPTSHMDKHFSKVFIELVRKWLPNKMVILLTHDQKILNTIDRYYELVEGEVILRRDS